MTKIMIADDEALIRKGLLALVDWRALDCEVVYTAENGQQIVDNLDACQPDIIISDIKMPVMDGLALAKYLCEHPARAGRKLILLTAFADFDYARAAIQYGVSDYVTKDGDMEVIAKAVERCKAMLLQERQSTVSTQDKIGSFLKNVLDGTMFAINEVTKGAQTYALFPNGYCVVSATLRCKPSVPDNEFSRLRQNVNRLIHNEFAQSAHYSILTGKHSFALVLDGIDTDSAACHCRELCGAVASLTALVLYTGVSAPCTTLVHLRATHRKAARACELHFYDGECVHTVEEISSPTALDATVLLDAMQDALRTVNTAACEQTLTQLFSLQRSAKVSVDEGARTAKTLFSLCRRALAHSGAAEDEHGHTEQGFAAALDGATSFEEACALQMQLVLDTCRAAASALQTDSSVIANAQSYIDLHFSEAITLPDIATAVGANASYLSRAFKQKTGASIVDTITQKRMERAKNLLAEGTLKIYEISAAVGIDDAAYFSNVFHKYTGMYPKAYHDFLVRQRQQE